MLDDHSFSLDNLRIKFPSKPNVIPLAVLISKVECDKEIDDLNIFIKQVYNLLSSKYAFNFRYGSIFKEGFLDFSTNDNIISCYYAKEVPLKICYEQNDLRLHTDRIRVIPSSYRVKVFIEAKPKTVIVKLFGGGPIMQQRALTFANYAIKEALGTGFRVRLPRFERNDMYTFLNNLGTNVNYLAIDPGQSEKFLKKIKAKVKGRNTELIVYYVHAKLIGIRITASPFVIDVIRESGILIKEIKGKINIIPGFNISVKITLDGRITFYIPQSLVGEDDEEIYRLGVQFYEEITKQRVSKPVQTTLEEYYVKRK
ncbi:MAG: hypothetical protein NDF54_07975 [archaeon GB-1867-035]|nr:hypothetical protein [Candidatus Culexmicrobium profundum]